MSKIILKKVNTKDELYRQYKQRVITNYVSSGELNFDVEAVDDYTQALMLDGHEISVEIDTDIIENIVFGDSEKYKNKYQREADLAIYFSDVFKQYPQNLIYDSNVWTYLNLTILSRYIKELYLSGKFNNPEDRVRRYLFNEASHSKIDRTGMRFLWYFGTKLSFCDSHERAITAMEFIDPVKALFERKMACNNIVMTAFVDAIIRGGKNNLLKNDELRKSVPHHIQCYAGVVNLDAFEYDELVEIMLFEQNRIVDKYKSRCNM